MNFEPSENEQIVEVDIINDGVYELVEEFRGEISLPLGSMGVLIRESQSSATITIEDDDSKF